MRSMVSTSTAKEESPFSADCRSPMLVNPNDESEYFYTGKNGYMVAREDGMLEVMDDLFGDLRDEKESLWERFKTKCWRIKEWFKDMKYAFKDFWFWFRHYDKDTNKSHQRFESWNLDGAILDMIEFNVPIIIEDKNGVPNEFCLLARQKAHEKDPSYDAVAAFRKNPNPSADELKTAEDMWNEELNRFLTHVRLYRYYEGYGVFDENDPAMAEIDKAYKDTIPTMPGTDGELDYMKLHEMTQSEWRAIWRWMSKHGQSLWT